MIGHYDIGMPVGKPFQEPHQINMDILGLIGYLLGILLLAGLEIDLEMRGLQVMPVPVQRQQPGKRKRIPNCQNKYQRYDVSAKFQFGFLKYLLWLLQKYLLTRGAFAEAMALEEDMQEA
jgi:hypothetical protein